MNQERALARRIEDRTARIGVLGLGYVGLPLVAAFQDAGFPVQGYDVDAARVQSLLSGRLSTDASEEVAAMIAGHQLQATDDLTSVRDCDVLLLCVPTPCDDAGGPDLGPVLAAARSVGERLRPGQLVVLESTTYPGTTDDLVELLTSWSGRRVGREVFVAYSPERIDPGTSHRFATTPKLVAGATPACGRLAQALYSTVTKVVAVSRPAVAEAAKCFENAYRLVNISLVNELAAACAALKIPVAEVLEAASTKPFGFQRFEPGPGAGGHCIPVDPLYLAWRAERAGASMALIRAAAAVNEARPQALVDEVMVALAARGMPLMGARVLVLGVAFKPNVADARNSTAGPLLDLLRTAGALVAFHDPHVQQFAGLARVIPAQLDTLIAAADAVVLHTDHREYDVAQLRRRATLLVDAWPGKRR